jgi:putative hydrolase of the HAD superfamily
MSESEHAESSEGQPAMEPLTPEELEQFLARARAEGRLLTPTERERIFGAQGRTHRAEAPEQTPPEREAAPLDPAQLDQLQRNFFPELGDAQEVPALPLIHGVIFDFDETLAYLTRPLDELMEQGAQAADAYMRSTGMELPENFWPNIVEARRFAQEKSEQEQEEHLADDAMSFLLQFFGYPASMMDPNVLKQAVDIFYAPEMTAWRLFPQALGTLQALQTEGYKLAVLANYNCDRVFQRTIDYLGLRPYLDVCVSSASVEYRKPDEKFFQVVLDRWGVLPYEVVVVGDALLYDIKGGIDLGALTVQCTFATTPQVAHDNTQAAGQIVPDAVIDDLRQLPALVQAWSH